MIAGPGIFRYGKPCPSLFQDFFGSFACSFGITQVGGGYYAPDLSTGAISSEDQGEGGLLVYAGVLGAVGLIDLGVFISDSLNPSKPGRVSPPRGSDGGGNGSDGGSGTWPTTVLPGAGSSTSGFGTSSIDMGKGPPNKNPDYDWKKFPGRRPEVRPTPTVRGEFKSKRIPLAICGALALGVGLGVTTVFGTLEVNQQTSDRGGGTGAALWALFLGTTGGTLAVCASL